MQHRALLDLIETLAAGGVARRESVFLLGFSQTCALNFRFAFTHAETLRGVVGICGGMPGDWETSEVYRTTAASVLYLHGARDEFYPPGRVAAYGEQLRRRARDVDVRSYDEGQEFAPALRGDVHARLVARAPRF